MGDEAIQTKPSDHQTVPDDDYAKLFIGGISSDTTEESMKEYMVKHGGEVEKVELKFDRVTGRMRGFGFVRFKEEASAQRILDSVPHVLDGKKIDPKKAEKQAKIAGSFGNKPETFKTKKIFVGGLKPETTEEKLREYFGEHGNVVDVEFIKERNSEQRRGFCFVEFDNEDVVDQLVKKQFHTIVGKTLEVKYAYTKEQQAQMAAKGMWIPGGRGRGRGGPMAMGMAGAGYGFYDPSMAGQFGMDPYGYAYGGAGMMGYGAAGMGAYGGVTYPTIDYSGGWSGRGAGAGGRGAGGVGPVFSYNARNTFHPYSR